MPVGDKKSISAELKAYPLKEMSKTARDFISNNKALSKKFAPIIWSKKIEVDPRKWTKKSLADGMLSVARYQMKILSMRVEEFAKDPAASKDAKKLEKALGKEYDDIKKEVIDKVSLAIDEVEADKGDNKKSLKDCKKAFADLAKCDLDTMYSVPRHEAQDAFEILAGSLGGKDDKKAVGDATSHITECIKHFATEGKEASDAVDTLIKAAKSTKANKGVAPELSAFADLVLKQEGKISSVLSNTKKLSDALEEALKLLKTGTVTERNAKDQAVIFKKLSTIDNSAKETLTAAKKLQPEFAKIEKSLK